MKKRAKFITVSAAEQVTKIAFFLSQYHPKTISILSIMEKYVKIVAVSVGDLIAQKVTTTECHNITFGKYSTTSCVIDFSLSFSQFLIFCSSSGFSYLSFTAGPGCLLLITFDFPFLPSALASSTGGYSSYTAALLYS